MQGIAVILNFGPIKTNYGRSWYPGSYEFDNNYSNMLRYLPVTVSPVQSGNLPSREPLSSIDGHEIIKELRLFKSGLRRLPTCVFIRTTS